MRSRFTILYLLISALCFSQKSNQTNALVTIRGNIGIPNVIGSKMFRTSFAGLYEGNLSVNIRLFDNFYVGAGYQNTQLQNNKFLKQQLFRTSVPYNTRLLCNGAFIRLGYDQFFSDKDKGYFGYALNTGYMLCGYYNVNADSSAPNKPFVPQHFTSPYIQPEVSANFIVERNLSFCLMLSYTTVFTHFDAKAPRFNQFEEVRGARNRYFMNWFTIGAGFNILINSKK